MKAEYPDYTNCCVNLMSSIAKRYNVDTGHKGLPLADKHLQKNYKNVVVILLDGLGQNVLVQNLPRDSFLRTHFLQELSAVFPSSTTPATVSFKTAKTPVEHAWWAHFLFFKEIGESINLYLNTNAYSKKPVGKDHIAHTVLPYVTVFEQIVQASPEVDSYALCPKEARDEAGIPQITYDTLQEMTDYVKTLCLNPGKKMIYAYYNHPDDTMHKKGVYSREVRDVLTEIDAQVEELCHNCPNTIFFISSDHGQTEIREVRDFADYPDIMDCIIAPPNGLSRVFNIYVKHEKRKTFEKLAKKYFGDKFLILSKDQVLKTQLLGDGIAHTKMDDLLGDYLLIAIDDCNLAITTLYKFSTGQPLGSHGGLTKDEMRTPLIMYANDTPFLQEGVQQAKIKPKRTAKSTKKQ